MSVTLTEWEYDSLVDERDELRRLVDNNKDGLGGDGVLAIVAERNALLFEVGELKAALEAKLGAADITILDLREDLRHLDYNYQECVEALCKAMAKRDKWKRVAKERQDRLDWWHSTFPNSPGVDL